MDLKDRIGGTICNTHLVSSITLHKIINTQTFFDTWRKRNPTTVDFTYHRPQFNIHRGNSMVDHPMVVKLKILNSFEFLLWF